MFSRCRLVWSTSKSLRRLYATHSNSPVVLRPYQESCVDACLEALASGSTRIGVSLPTGSGKTTVFVSLLSRIRPPSRNTIASNALIIVNSVELAQQVAAQIEQQCAGERVEIEQGGEHRASGDASFTVATYQTLLQPGRLEKFRPEQLKAVVVDEAHHAAAPSYRRILSYFHSSIGNPESPTSPPAKATVPIFGFSATFSRHDGLALGSVFERIVYHRDFLEMIKEQWLCNVRFTSVRANIDLTGVTVNSRTGDFNATSLAHVINTSTVNRLIVQTWLDRAADRRSTLVFCVNLAHVRALTDAFREAGIDARYVYSGTPAVERRALVEMFKAGGFPVLVNCAVLTEGTDIPNIDCVVVARPTRSRNVFAQMIGRGMRLSPDTGKEDCRIIDFVNSQNAVPGVISAPTLFGLDPSEVVDGECTDEMLEQRKDETNMEAIRGRNNMDPPDPKSVTYIDYDNPFEFVEEACGAPHILKLSSNAWIGCGDDIYVLECLGKGHIRIERIEGAEGARPCFCAHYTRAVIPLRQAMTYKIPPYQSTKQILKASTLFEAIRGADTYAKKKVSYRLRRSAKWRREPATDSQKAWIHTRWKKPAQEQKIATMTKGEASNIISRLKHGAQVCTQSCRM
ncbi:hypothetical protein IEO21_00118 [Rhodonia placenta]|uniref:P-loop containing nucleoside triphosphate hydrolase protein n=1 Tax=Rhodonia placenta TaxID=104341 RepID=A0A8H7PC40_9APHY|nr:hypothetical protein IEO21_00118 [Postia placenta]